MMAQVVRDIDRGYSKLVRHLRKYRNGISVRVGIQSTDASEERSFGMTNVALAAVHEFGSRDGTIPQRSFLRGTADREVALFQRMLGKAAKETALTGELETALGRIGEVGVSKVKRTINQSIGLKALKPATIRRKRGKTRPLIDTGILKNAITWKMDIGR